MTTIIETDLTNQLTDQDLKIERLNQQSHALKMEIQVLIDTLQDLYSMNSLGKTKQLADLIDTTLSNYGYERSI